MLQEGLISGLTSGPISGPLFGLVFVLAFTWSGLTYAFSGVCLDTLSYGSVAEVCQHLLNLLLALVAWNVLVEVAYKGTGGLKGL